MRCTKTRNFTVTARLAAAFAISILAAVAVGLAGCQGNAGEEQRQSKKQKIAEDSKK